jgi:hypothetical protein
MLSASEEGEALITTVPVISELRFPADGITYVNALRSRLPILGLREGPCYCGTVSTRGHCDATGYHASICVAKGEKSKVQVTHSNGKHIIVAMCTEAGYRVETGSSNSTRRKDPNSRKRTPTME